MQKSIGDRKFIARLLVVFMLLIIFLYTHVQRENHLTQLRLKVPILTNRLRILDEQNQTLQYEVDRFESPSHLIQLGRKPEFGHLEFPLKQDVLVIERPLQARSSVSNTRKGL